MLSFGIFFYIKRLITYTWEVNLDQNQLSVLVDHYQFEQELLHSTGLVQQHHRSVDRHIAI